MVGCQGNLQDHHGWNGGEDADHGGGDIASGSGEGNWGRNQEACKQDLRCGGPSVPWNEAALSAGPLFLHDSDSTAWG